MRARPRLVSCVRPIPQVYRPGRRVSPKRERGVWWWRGTPTERLRAWTWEHKILTDLLIMAILSAGIFCALWWLLDLGPEVGP